MHRPNLLLLLSDDHPQGAVGAYGGRLKPWAHTPNLDRLAREGQLFRHAFATTSLCAPSRATIMTGMYAHAHGVTTLFERLVQRRLPSMARELQRSGYLTGLFGKWQCAAPRSHRSVRTQLLTGARVSRQPARPRHG